MLELFVKICTALGVDADAARSPSRKSEYIEARQILAHIMYDPDNITKSLEAIAGFLNRDRTTIISALQTFDAIYLTEQSFRYKVNKIKEGICQ